MTLFRCDVSLLSTDEASKVCLGENATRMSEIQSYSESTKVLTTKDFERLSGFISDHCGIKMPPAKKTLLESRLQKRLRNLGLRTFHDYCNLIFKGPEGERELVLMIDAVTTNKTDFFREPAHFSFLTDTVLPEFLQNRGPGVNQQFTVWSAGCSSGEEPYTLAIVLSEFAANNPGFHFSIMATDISTKVLEKARVGIYEQDQIAMIPLFLKQKYFLKSRDRDKGLVRIVPSLRSNINFQWLNLMEERYAIPELSLDVIFCRNVMIYFESQTQNKLLGRYCRYLKTGGYLFLGHSETVQGFNHPLARIASTIYRKVS
jgi:chemotaxis protein methyltransferase CheR